MSDDCVQTAPYALIRRLSASLCNASMSEQQAEAYAWQIIEHCLGLSRADCLKAAYLCITAEQEACIVQVLNQLTVDAMPLQYIRGYVPFLEFTFSVVPPVLIPRPETEWWVGLLIDRIKARAVPPSAILDLCTGSGCIGLSLARSFPHTRVDAVDSADHAVALAQRNAVTHGIENCRILQGDLYSPVTGCVYEYIVANPPYIPELFRATLDRSVVTWEDHDALFAGDDGLACIRPIIANAHRYAASGAQLEIWLEVDSTHADRVDALLHNAQFCNREILLDYAGQPRVVTGVYYG